MSGRRVNNLEYEPVKTSDVRVALLPLRRITNCLEVTGNRETLINAVSRQSQNRTVFQRCICTTWMSRANTPYIMDERRFHVPCLTLHVFPFTSLPFSPHHPLTFFVDPRIIANNLSQFFHGAVFIPVVLSLLPECCVAKARGNQDDHQTKVRGVVLLGLLAYNVGNSLDVVVFSGVPV